MTSTALPISEFEQITCDDVKQIIMHLPIKSCFLDILPTWLVKDNLPILLPVITHIVNASLSFCIFQTLYHIPAIKKS